MSAFLYWFFTGSKSPVMVEDAAGGVVLVGGNAENRFTEFRFIFRLPHVGFEWIEFPRQLQVGRRNHVAMLVSDSYANCSYSAK